MLPALITAALAAPVPRVPCFTVRDAGMQEANGVYVEDFLNGYAGPPAFHKQGTDLWLFRWHQTWWHLGTLKQPLLSEADFTDPVIYTALVQEPRDFPPEDGWTNDVMREYGTPPAPTVVGPCSCSVDAAPSTGMLDPWARGAAVIYTYASKAVQAPVQTPAAPEDSRVHVMGLGMPDGRRLADHALVLGCVMGVVLAMLVCVHTRRPGHPPDAVKVEPPVEIVEVEPLDAKLIPAPQPAVAAA
jgi:hypothetical protein